MLATRTHLPQVLTVRESTWYLAGPFPAKSFAEELFPEKGVPLDARARPPLPWQPKAYANGAVHHLDAGDSTATYLYRLLVASAPGTLQISLGSDDGLVFWFNGEKIISQDVPRGVEPDQDIVHVKVRPGTNTVLLKIFNRTGDCGFYYNTDQSADSALAPVAAQFPVETKLFAKYAEAERWFGSPGDTSVERQAIKGLLDRLPGAEAEARKFADLVKADAPAGNPEWLGLFLALARQAEALEEARAAIPGLNLGPLRLAVEDLLHSFGDRYARGQEFRAALIAFEKDLPALKQAVASGDKAALEKIAGFRQLERDALLSNPALDFEQMLVVKRREDNLGLPQNWQGNSSLNPHVENEIC